MGLHRRRALGDRFDPAPPGTDCGDAGAWSRDVAPLPQGGRARSQSASRLPAAHEAAKIRRGFSISAVSDEAVGSVAPGATISRRSRVARLSCRSWNVYGVTAEPRKRKPDQQQGSSGGVGSAAQDALTDWEIMFAAAHIVAYWWWSQPVDATLALNLFAGVSIPKALRGRSLS
jgi:hypothetical protein